MEKLANRRCGAVETAIRKLIAPGSILHTVRSQAPFEVHEFSEPALVLLFGGSKTRTSVSWPCLESTMRLLTQGDWVEIGPVHGTAGVAESLNGHLQSNGGPRTIDGGYVAAVLEAAGLVDVDSSTPARVRLSKTVVTDGNGAPGCAGAHDKEDTAAPFDRIFGALKGTVTIAPGTDLTAPTGEEWDAAR